jgi:hypothetical protein
VALGYTGAHIRGTEVNYELRSTQRHNHVGGTQVYSQAVDQLFQTRQMPRPLHLTSTQGVLMRIGTMGTT